MGAGSVCMKNREALAPESEHERVMGVRSPRRDSVVVMLGERREMRICYFVEGEKHVLSKGKGLCMD
ncbi:hypothetical protein VNO77_05382 [Canavalia gladiata]|uniref:Uncharacterized protein n=1 Tax=Canavalia gladiata TaxID=3824 RepID=A0AAN9N4T2_CANGL